MKVWETSDFEDLRAVYEEGRLRLFVGAGVSNAAGLPGWPQLVEKLRERVRERSDGAPHDRGMGDLVAAKRYIDALSVARRVLGSPAYERIVSAALDDSRVRRPLPPVLQAVAELRSKLRAVVTTNLDRLLERALDWAGLERPSQDAASKSKLVIKLHGSLHDPRTWVLTREEYDKATNENPRLRALLTTLYHGDPLLFVGYGLADDDFDARLAEIRAWSQGDGQVVNHFALVPREKLADNTRWQLRDAGITLLEYGNADGTHAELTEALRRLACGPGPLLDWAAAVADATRDLNAHFGRHAQVMGIARELPDLEAVGELRTPPEVAAEASAIRPTLGTNDRHGLLAADPDWRQPRVLLRYQSTDFATVEALRHRGNLPRVLSASGVLVDASRRTLLLHKRSESSATYPGRIHTIGGAFMAEHPNHVSDGTLGDTLFREVHEESRIRLGEMDWPAVMVDETATGFVQYVALGVPATTERLAANWEGKTFAQSFDDLEQRLLQAREWTPSGKLHILLWLAAGAPGCENARFGSRNAQELLKAVLANSATDYGSPSD